MLISFECIGEILSCFFDEAENSKQLSTSNVQLGLCYLNFLANTYLIGININSTTRL